MDPNQLFLHIFEGLLGVAEDPLRGKVCTTTTLAAN